MNVSEHIIVGIAVALGCGMVIGVEREKRKAIGSRRAQAGVRTFALTALCGSLTQVLQQPWLTLVGALMILLLAVIAYWQERSNDPGVTTEIALFITYLVGVTAIDFPVLSAGISVIVAGLLASRSTLHHFSKKILSESELNDGLYFAAAALVVFPLLPDHATTWLIGANPRRLWGLAVLLMGLQAGGYIALRIAGPKVGLSLSGLASGFVSSTATVIAMGTRARNNPLLLNASVTGALSSNVATFLLFFVVSTAIYPASLAPLTPCIFSGLLVAVIVAGISYRRNVETNGDFHQAGRAFNLPKALGFAAILSGVTAIIGVINMHYGHTAVSIGAAIAGLADVHAATASVLSLAASGALPLKEIVLPILIALTMNTISKIVGAFIAGGIPYGLRVGIGLVLAVLAVWMCFFVLR